jgi:hypothetical protein
MAEQNIITVSVTRATASLTRRGFGTPLLLVTHDTIPDIAKIYGSLDEMLTDGFLTTDQAYKLAAALLGQNPKVAQFVLGKRQNQPTRIVRLDPGATPVASTLYRVTVNGTNFDYTTDAVPTPAEITDSSTGLVAWLNQPAWVTLTTYNLGDHVRADNKIYVCVVAGDSGATGPSGTGSGQVDGTVTWDYQGPEQDVRGVDNTGTLDIQSADAPGGSALAGIPFSLTFDRLLFSGKDNTPDAGIAADLAAVRNVNDTWYGVTGDWYDEATADAMAAAIAPLFKIHLWSCQDTDVLDPAVDTDAFSVLNGKAYERSGGVWKSDPHNGIMAGAIGRLFPSDPGKNTWKFKTIVGQTADEFTEGEITALTAKKANHYLENFDLPMFAEGVMHVGEFIDIIRGTDFIIQRIKEDNYLLFKNSDKVPYTDAGYGAIQGTTLAVLLSTTKDGGGSGQILTASPAPTVTVPLVADVNPNTRAQRRAVDIQFRGTYAGAIHFADIVGTLSP